MATLSVRNLPDDVHLILRHRAASAGHSMEAEVRAILMRECTQEKTEGEDLQAVVYDIQQWTSKLLQDGQLTNAVDELIAERRTEAARE